MLLFVYFDAHNSGISVITISCLAQQEALSLGLFKKMLINSFNVYCYIPKGLSFDYFNEPCKLKLFVSLRNVWNFTLFFIVKTYILIFFRFFVVQVYVPLTKDFAVELIITNINNSKRRIVLSSSSKDISSTPLHAKLPLSIMKRDVWLNLCFDMRSLTNEMFPNQTYKALEEFTISGKI